MNFLHLPDIVLDNVFGYLSYDEIANKRLVCKKIDQFCQRLLNRGFAKLIQRQSNNYKRIKSLLPRRESERSRGPICNQDFSVWLICYNVVITGHLLLCTYCVQALYVFSRNHPLARHMDILTCIETRISMLSITYSKYIDLNLCCFIPGKVIDEILRILKMLEATTKPLRAHEVLQELRDISSMAIEHFDEKISYPLKKTFIFAGYKGTSRVPESTNSKIIGTNQNRSHLHCPIGLGLGCSGEKTPIDAPDNQLVKITRKKTRKVNRFYFDKLNNKYNTISRKFNQLLQIQRSQTKKLTENSHIISELNSQISEMKKRLDEIDAKNLEMSTSMYQLSTPVSLVGNSTRRLEPPSAVLLKRKPIHTVDRGDTEKKPKHDEQV